MDGFDIIQKAIIDAKKSLEETISGKLLFINNFSSNNFWFGEFNKGFKMLKCHSDILGEKIYFCFKVCHHSYEIESKSFSVFKCSLELRDYKNYKCIPIYRGNFPFTNIKIYKNIKLSLCSFLRNENEKDEFKVPFQIGCNNMKKFN